MESFGSIKRAVAVAAVVAGAALAPAAAQADVWSTGGAPYAGPAQFAGTLSTSGAGRVLSNCDVVLKADLDNGAPGGVARGELQDYLLGAAAGGTCSSTVPNCSPSITVYAPPSRPISTSGSNVTFSGIYYSLVYSGAGCVWAGVPFYVQGSMTGSVASGTNVVTFTNSPGLTTTLGPATVSGSLYAYAENAAGNPDPAQPITLQP